MSPRHSLASYALAVLTSPVLLLVGDPLMRYALHRFRGQPTGNGGYFISAAAGPTYRIRVFFMNPLVIALTAPSRWAGDRLRRNSRG